jgi:hypothetical protein
LHERLNAGAVSEPGKYLERFLADALHVALVGGEGHERSPDSIELGRVAANQPGKSGSARLERAIRIPTDVEEARGHLDPVAEERGEDRIAANATIGAGRDSNEILRRFRGGNRSKIRHSGVKGPANERANCDDVAISDVENDAHRAYGTAIRRTR